jgi:pyruvate,orthophosphate dikinase
MNDEITSHLSFKSNNPEFSLDTYKNFLQTYGASVGGIDVCIYDDLVEKEKKKYCFKDREDINIKCLKDIINLFKKTYSVPENPWDQLYKVIEAAFNSWNSDSAIEYRNLNQIQNCSGISICIQIMVHGTMNNISGSGIVYNRNPSTGENHLYGILMFKHIL